LSAGTRPAVDRRIWLLAGVAVVGLSIWAAVTASTQTGDYGNPHCAHWQCDDPAASLHALVTGHLGTFFRTQSVIGLTSVALRAPAVAIAHAAGGGLEAEYRAGALVCIAAASLLATWLAMQAHRRGAPLAAALAALVLWTVAIVWSRALFFGHPEEPLAAALVIAAAVLAADRRPVAAGVALGLAIGTKEWAFLAAPAALAAGARDEWRRMLAPAAIAVALTLGVMAVGNPSAFRSAHEAQQRGDRHTTTPANVWFRAGHKRATGHRGQVVAYVIYPPKVVGRWCRPFVILLALVTSFLFVRRRGAGSADVLGLIALLFLLRVVFDTQTFSYHLIPMLMATTAWEVIGRRRFPVVGAAAMVAFQLTVHQVAPHMSANAFNAIYLAWTLPLAAYLLVVVMRREQVAAAQPARLC
jgi:hypothetical protein